MPPGDTIGLAAKLTPELDERQTDREIDKLEKKMERAETLQPSFEDGTGGGFAGRTSTDGSAGSRGGGGGAAGAAGLAARAGGTGAAVLGTVFLGGTVALGLLNEMAKASSRMQATSSILGQAWENTWAPFGDTLSKWIEPMAKEFLDFSTQFRRIASDKGLMVGIEWVATRNQDQGSAGWRRSRGTGGAPPDFSGWWESIKRDVAGGLTDAINWFGQTVTSGAQGIRSSLIDLLNGVTALRNKGVGLLMDAFEFAGHTVTDGAAGIGKAFAGAVTAIGEFVSNLPGGKKIGEKLTTAGERMATSIENFRQRTNTKISEFAALEPVEPNWSDVIPTVPDWTNLKPPLPDWSDLQPRTSDAGERAASGGGSSGSGDRRHTRGRQGAERDVGTGTPTTPNAGEAAASGGAVNLSVQIDGKEVAREVRRNERSHFTSRLDTR